MVIGPTPPGTGVIAPATSPRLGESHVADDPGLALARFGVGTRLMPTSITMAPGLTQSPRISSGPPDRGDEDVGAAADVRQVAGLGMGRS